jgi:hypothetical protein
LPAAADASAFASCFQSCSAMSAADGAGRNSDGVRRATCTAIAPPTAIHQHIASRQQHKSHDSGNKRD